MLMFKGLQIIFLLGCLALAEGQAVACAQQGRLLLLCKKLF
jgi:hypothetical protein